MHIRSATQADQETITSIIRAARLNPMDLDWRRFVVAVEDDDPERSRRIIGIGQIKPHNDGSRELASIAVIPERQRQGIGAALIHALTQNEKPPLYLMCRDAMEAYYQRFGFRKIGAAEMTTYYRRMWRLVNALPEFVRAKVRVIVMKWE